MRVSWLLCAVSETPVMNKCVKHQLMSANQTSRLGSLGSTYAPDLTDSKLVMLKNKQKLATIAGSTNWKSIVTQVKRRSYFRLDY